LAAGITIFVLRGQAALASEGMLTPLANGSVVVV
jgi:hypothetical protein